MKGKSLKYKGRNAVESGQSLHRDKLVKLLKIFEVRVTISRFTMFLVPSYCKSLNKFILT